MAKQKNTENELNNFLTKTHQELFGNDGSLDKETQADMDMISNSISNYNKSLEQSIGNDPIDFFNSVFYKTNKQTPNNKSQSTIDPNNPITKFLDGNSNPLFSDGLMLVEQNRINLYTQYALIYDHIPQIAQALDTYVDNIISPDDFTKKSLNIAYDNIDIKSNQDTEDSNINSIIENINKINRTYKIESDKSQRLVRDTLIKGDQFVLVLDLDEEVSKMITEDNSSLNSTHIKLTESEYSEIKDNFINKSSDSKKEDMSKVEIETSISECINGNIIINEDPSILLEDNNELDFEFNNYLDENSYLGNEADLDKTIKNYNGIVNDKQNKRSYSRHKSSVGLSGCVVKVLEPKNVVKLELDDICYGYYVIEGVDFYQSAMDRVSNVKNTNSVNGMINDTNTQAIGMGMTMSQNNLSNFGSEDSAKQRLITDIFVNGIAHKLNKNIIKKNKEFKEIIYSLLRQNYIVQKQIKITYISPKNMVHFNINKTKVYGDSLFRKILFPAKLYLSVLVSSMLSKLTRAQDKRVYYVEVGLGNDAEEVVQSFIRDIKNKEFKMADYNDINVILNQTGSMTDYYIPVVNGEKPVEIDTLQGMDIQQDNELLEYLLKSMISGLGVPSSFLNYTEDVEFVRTLTMQNGQFVRTIINLQKQLGEQFSELFRKIYRIEFKDDFKRKSNFNINLDDIVVNFAPPLSLSVTTMSDQINNSQTVIDFIIKTLVKNADENPKLLFEVTKQITKDFLPSIDWNKYELIVEQATNQVNKDEIKELASQPSSNMDGLSDEEMDQGTSF